VQLSPADLADIEDAIPPSAVAGTRYDAHQMNVLDSERESGWTRLPICVAVRLERDRVAERLHPLGAVLDALHERDRPFADRVAESVDLVLGEPAGRDVPRHDPAATSCFRDGNRYLALTVAWCMSSIAHG